MRKKPQQQRAKLIVDHILQAAQICIVEQGLMHITTPKIAEKAGVSVGSLYQYFENKEEIIQELLRRKSENLGLALKQMVITQEQLSIQEIFNTLEPLVVDLRLAFLPKQIKGIPPAVWIDRYDLIHRLFLSLQKLRQ